LTVTGRIDSVSGTGPSGLSKEGAATVVLAGTLGNTYRGTTTVDAGTLTLNKDNGNAVPGNLQINSGAIVAVSQPEQIANTAAVEVDSSAPKGGLQLNAQETIGSLTLSDGTVNGNLSINPNARGKLILNGNVTVNGTLSNINANVDVGSVARTFTVNGNSVLTLTNGTVTGTGGLTKVGTGSLVFDSTAGNLTGTRLGTTTVQAGTLAGTGTVNALTAAGGTIKPGDDVVHGTLTPQAGTLTANGSVTFGPGSTVVVDLNGTGAGQFDQIVVTSGTVNLGNALLTGSSSSSLSGNPTFNILDNQGSGATTGTFDRLDASNNRVPWNPATDRGNIGGSSFSISYSADADNNGGANDVRLTREGAAGTSSALQNRSITSPVTEGSVATLTGTIIDADPNGTFVLQVTWGDGTPTETFTFPPSAPREVSLQHRYVQEGQFTAHLQWQDVNGPPTTADLAVTVTEAAPVVNAGGNATVRFGKVFSQTGSFSDPSGDTWTATVNYGDGTKVQALQLNGRTFQLQHRYKKAGKFRVTVQVRDDTGLVGTDSFVVNVSKKGPSHQAAHHRR
jgi:autotransporter-associated beta strand protein